MKNKKLPDNFCGLGPEHSSYNKSEIVILPVPFDKTSSWISGSSKGPRAIIDASKNMELYDIETGSEVFTKGIHTAPEIRAGDSERMVTEVYKKVTALLNDNKFTVVIGGEHTVSLGSIKAHDEKFDDMTVLQLDAHSDMRDSYEGNIYSHACVMKRVREITSKTVSAGIRSMDSSELKNIDRNSIFYASDIIRSRDWTEKVVDLLTDKVYITIDLDVLDPSIMPSTGTPEPGGLGWYDLIGLLERVSEKKNIVGFDVVELCPAANNVAPDFLAAKLTYKLISMIFKK